MTTHLQMTKNIMFTFEKDRTQLKINEHLWETDCNLEDTIRYQFNVQKCDVGEIIQFFFNRREKQTQLTNIDLSIMIFQASEEAEKIIMKKVAEKLFVWNYKINKIIYRDTYVHDGSWMLCYTHDSINPLFRLYCENLKRGANFTLNSMSITSITIPKWMIEKRECDIDRIFLTKPEANESFNVIKSMVSRSKQ